MSDGLLVWGAEGQGPAVSPLAVVGTEPPLHTGHAAPFTPVPFRPRGACVWPLALHPAIPKHHGGPHFHTHLRPHCPTTPATRQAEAPSVWEAEEDILEGKGQARGLPPLPPRAATRCPTQRCLCAPPVCPASPAAPLLALAAVTQKPSPARPQLSCLLSGCRPSGRPVPPPRSRHAVDVG